MKDISVILTNCNYSQYLARCIRSVNNQTVRDRIHFILVDDSSSDDSPRIIARHADIIDEILMLPRNVGLGNALDYALVKVHEQLTFRLDADDYINPLCIEVLWRYLNLHRERNVWGASIDYYLEELDGIRGSKLSAITYPIGAGIMYRTDNLLKIGGWDHNFRIGEDVDLALRIEAAGGEIKNVPLPYYNYCQHSDSLSHGNLKSGEYNV